MSTQLYTLLVLFGLPTGAVGSAYYVNCIKKAKIGTDSSLFLLGLFVSVVIVIVAGYQFGKLAHLWAGF